MLNLSLGVSISEWLASSTPDLIPKRARRQDAEWDLISYSEQVAVPRDQRIDARGTCTGQDPTVVSVLNRHRVGRFRPIDDLVGP